ncbi:MAG: hypothetical protein K8T89_20825 [Planctomycetes bacterium]|nr:hypothetical protein [Planctomycetota bacterium]
MANPLALKFGFSALRFVWALWMAPYRVAIVSGIGLLLIAISQVWRWFNIPSRHFFGVDIDADLFFGSGILVFAMLVAIVVPAIILILIGFVWKQILVRTDDKVSVIRKILNDSLKQPYGLAYLAMNYRGVILEAYDVTIIRLQLSKEGIDIAERDMLSELRRLGGQVLHEVEVLNFRFRQLKLGNMHRVIYDPKHGGGLLYYHVHANQYLLGCAIEIEPLESKNGGLPPANLGMEQITKDIRTAQGLPPRKPRASAAAGEANAPSHFPT